MIEEKAEQELEKEIKEEKLKEEPVEKIKEKATLQPKKRTVSKKTEKPKKKYICHGIWHGKLALETMHGTGELIDIPEGYENAQAGQIIEL